MDIWSYNSFMEMFKIMSGNSRSFNARVVHLVIHLSKKRYGIKWKGSNL